MYTTVKTPLTDALLSVKVRKSLSYQQMAELSGVRSQAWFHKQLKGDPRTNTPPWAKADWEGFAKLLHREEEWVREAIVEEWFGLAPGERSLPEPVFALARKLAQMYTDNRDDYELLRALIVRVDASFPMFSLEDH